MGEGNQVAILLEQEYEDLEFWYPCLRLREGDIPVKVVAPKGGAIYKSKHNYPARADLSIDEVDAWEFVGLIIPGGYSPDHMRQNPKMVEFVRAMYEADKPVAAICHGPWMFCSADIVRGKTVTSYPSIRDDLINAGANWTDGEVVTDGCIITSRRPGDLPAFMTTFIAALQRQSARQRSA